MTCTSSEESHGVDDCANKSEDREGRGQGTVQILTLGGIIDDERAKERAVGHRKERRRRGLSSSPLLSVTRGLFLVATLLLISLRPGVHAQDELSSAGDTQQLTSATLTTANPSTAVTISSPWRTVTIDQAEANGTVNIPNGNLLPDGVPVVTQLDVAAQEPIIFHIQPSYVVPSNPLWISATLCSGPSVVPLVVAENRTQSINSLDRPTLPRMYVSTDENNQKPGPDSLPNRGDGFGNVQYFVGGHAQLTLATEGDADDRVANGAWISIYPPETVPDASGTWNITIIVSTSLLPANVSSSAGLTFSDSDTTRALLTTSFSFKADSTPPNATVYVLPTDGEHSLPMSESYNSSFCALESAFQAYNSTPNSGAPAINATITSRGSTQLDAGDERRLQYELTGLQPSTNYTAWLIQHTETDITSPNSTTSTSFMATTVWPAIKFTTKNNENCRLVYDVPFCPQVAYSIPVGPTVSTDRALFVINETFAPNFLNFSRTVDTFPCGSMEQGNYSPVKTCDDCKRAYQDWLCSVTMPRCTDTLGSTSSEQSVTNTSSLTAAYTNVYNLTGKETALNTGLLPYIVDRGGNHGSKSRRSYIENELEVTSAYGEVLPCIYTCFFVSRSCPSPLVQWACPIWDVSAQIDYGTFADSGQLGLGAGENGGAGTLDGQRFGGPSRYVAQDGFGKTYCNSLGVDLRLREENGARRLARTATSMAVAGVMGAALFFI